jgi:hypothetical protein
MGEVGLLPTGKAAAPSAHPLQIHSCSPPWPPTSGHSVQGEQYVATGHSLWISSRRPDGIPPSAFATGAGRSRKIEEGVGRGMGGNPPARLSVEPVRAQRRSAAPDPTLSPEART